MRLPLLFVAATTLVTACGGADSASKSTQDAGGTLVLAIAEPRDLFPPLVADGGGRLVTDQVFDRLAEIKPELSTIGDKGFTPRLATSWKWSADSLSIAFSIDPRARWHDGKPVLASDVRYTFRAITDPEIGSPWAPLVTNIDSVSVRDSLTAVVWFKKHTPEQFYDVAYQLVIIPEHVYAAIPPRDLHTSPITRSPIGSGRFRFVKWEPGVRLELTSDTANYRGRALLDRIVLTPATETNVSVAKVLSGDADLMEAFPIDQLAQLDTSTVAGPLPFPNLGYVYMTMNPYDPNSPHAPHPIFGDMRVRRAFAMAADRRAMLQNVFGKLGRLSHGPFPMTASYADSTLRLPPFDTTAAKALLDSAGWHAGAKGGVRAKNGRPLRFKVITPSISLTRRSYATLLQEQFRHIGAQMDIDVLEQATLAAYLERGKYDASLDSWTTDPGPSGMKQRWGTEAIGYVEGKGVSGANTMRYSNRGVDATLDSATSTFDIARAKAYASRASQLIVDDAPAVFLYDMFVVNALNRRVIPTGVRTDAWWANLADWTIPADKRIARDRMGLAQAQP
jgi:peptide/nickel transport system substrate-binding protein